MTTTDEINDIANSLEIELLKVFTEFHASRPKQVAFYVEDSESVLDSIYLKMSKVELISDAMLSCDLNRQNILVIIAIKKGIDYLSEQESFLQAIISEDWYCAAKKILNLEWTKLDFINACTYASIFIFSGSEMDKLNQRA